MKRLLLTALVVASLVSFAGAGEVLDLSDDVATRAYVPASDSLYIDYDAAIGTVFSVQPATAFTVMDTTNRELLYIDMANREIRVRGQVVSTDSALVAGMWDLLRGEFYSRIAALEAENARLRRGTSLYYDNRPVRLPQAIVPLPRNPLIFAETAR